MFNYNDSIRSDFARHKIKYLIIAFIVLINISKLSLVGSGFITFSDEKRYAVSGKALHYMSELKFRDALNLIFSTQGRPGDAILKIIPNAFQYASARLFNLEYYESKNSWPLFIFNYIIYALILVVLFKFSKLILEEDLPALVCVLLYSSLTNSYLYLRHALPYDMGLLIFMMGLHQSIRYAREEQFSFKKSFLLGAALFFGYLVYPGYFALFIICTLLFFFTHLSKGNFFHKIYHLSFYACGSISCLLIFEALARLGGRSYIADTILLSTTVIQGSFEESFEFIVKYFFQVERPAGIFVLIALACFYFAIIYKIIKNRNRQELIVLTGIIVLGCYLAYACLGYFRHQMAMYGRLLHQYLPFICVFVIAAVNLLAEKIKVRQGPVLLLLSVFFILNFVTGFIEYKSLAYPRDVGWELVKNYNLKNIINICEHGQSTSVIPPQTEVKLRYNNDPEKKVLVVNCCNFFPVDDLNNYHPYIPGTGQHLIMSKPHFINFKAYQFEGFDVAERKNIDKINFQIKIFSAESEAK